MKIATARAAITAMALVLSCGAWAADKKGDDNKVSRGDKNFIAKAMKGGATEVELGKLAAQNAASPQVKQFGQRMVDDHSKAGDELQAIASKLGYTPPKNAGPDKGEVKKFSKMKAEKFDREYVKHMVKDHEKDVKLFQKQAEKGESAELKQFAAKTLPTLQEHLKMVRAMKDQDKGDKPAKKS